METITNEEKKLSVYLYLLYDNEMRIYNLFDVVLITFDGEI